MAFALDLPIVIGDHGRQADPASLINPRGRHMTNRRNLILSALIALTPAVAQADQAAATACSGGLSPEAKTIYGKVAPSVTPATDIKEALTSAVRPMVMNGSMKRDVARTAAEEAGECLKLLK